MRRLLIVCAVAALTGSLFSLLAVAQKSSDPSPNRENSAVVAQPQTEQEQPAITTATGRAPVVLATGIAVRSLALDSQGNFYVTNAAAPNRVFTLTGLSELLANPASNSFASAHLALVAGNGTTGSLGDGGSALSSQFDLKLDSLTMHSGIAVAPDGTMLIADTLNSTIRRIAGSDSSEPGIVRSIAGHWGPRQEITLTEPLEIALDRAGNLYVADHDSGAVDLLPFATDSSTATQLSVLAHVASPAEIALTTDGTKAFVGSPDTGAVFGIDTQSHAIHPVPGFVFQATSSKKFEVCAPQPSGAFTKLAVCPSGLAVDGTGNLFVADANSGEILRVDAKSQQLTVAASGLKSPGEMTFDSSGNLYVAEQGANRLLKFVAMGDPAANLTIGLPNPLPAPPAPRVCPEAPAGSYNFCDQPTGAATATETFTLTATTAVTGLNISFSGANPGDFQQSNNCGTSLAATAQCQINVDFAPSGTGARQATLSVSDSAGDSATGSLYGTGDDYEITLNGTSQELSVFQGGSVTFKFNITPDTVFGGSVAIVCPVSSQLPTLTTCTPNPATVTVTPNTPAPFTITFDTTYNGVTAGSGSTSSNGSFPMIAPSNKRTPPGSSAPLLWLIPVLLVVVGVFVAFLLRAHRQSTQNRNFAWVSLVLTMICGISVFVACKHSAIQPGLNTTVGTKNLTIQGTAQNAGRGNTITLDVVAH